jgi:hypothetical protein
MYTIVDVGVQEGGKAMMITTRNVLHVIVAFSAVSLLMLGNVVSVAWADEEQTLTQKAAALNSTTTSAQQEGARVQALAKQFKVSEVRVTELRNQKMGWGEITISLAMAEHLSATSKTPLTTEQALTKIEQLRSEKIGWGKIALDLGFKLGPVVSAVERGEKTIHTADREAGVRIEKSTKAEKAERAERAERPVHVDRPERPGR